MTISGSEVANDDFDSVQKVRVFVRKKRAKKTVQTTVEVVKPEILDQKVRLSFPINEDKYDFFLIVLC